MAPLINHRSSFTSLMLFLSSLGFLGFILYFCQGVTWPKSSIILTLAAIAALGLCLRSARRYFFFKTQISSHRSFSYEVVIQAMQIINPLLSSRAFEMAFISRESHHIKSELLQQWTEARLASLLPMVLFMISLIYLAWGQQIIALISAGFTILALMTALKQWRKKRYPNNILLSVISTGLCIWLIEGGLFVYAVQSILPMQEGLFVYLFFTGIYENFPIPMAFGVAEIPALLMLAEHSQAALGILLCWHLLRLGITALLSLIYLPRYKLRITDFMHHDLILHINQSLRPKTGWPKPAIKAGQPYLSIVIPAYNEEKRLPSFLQSVEGYTKTLDFDVEVLVVDDGSSDATADCVLRAAKTMPQLRLIRQHENQGKGRAVQRGMFEAKAYYRLFIDADGATPIEETDHLLAVIEDYDIAIGSRRKHQEGVQQNRGLARNIMASVFHRIVNVLAVPHIDDTQCGCKIFRYDVAQHVFHNLTEAGWAFDVEVLYRSQLAAYRIKEVSVNWSEIEGSKVSPVKDAIRMFCAIFRIRYYHAGYIRTRQQSS